MVTTATLLFNFLADSYSNTLLLVLQWSVIAESFNTRLTFAMKSTNLRTLLNSGKTLLGAVMSSPSVEIAKKMRVFWNHLIFSYLYLLPFAVLSRATTGS
jgi:hypothetical protein